MKNLASYLPKKSSLGFVSRKLMKIEFFKKKSQIREKNELKIIFWRGLSETGKKVSHKVSMFIEVT